MRCHLTALALCLSLAATAEGQSLLGTYTLAAKQGPTITLVLQKDAQGKIVGSFSGNGASYTVTAEPQGNGVAGWMSGGGLRSYFEAERDGANLHMIVADVGADGKPDYVHARELLLTPSTAGASVAPAGSPAPPSTKTGNPLAAGAASADKFAGTFASTDVTLSLNRQGSAYTGTIRYQGADYPATARPTGETLTGSFQAGGQSYDLMLASAGDGKYVNLTTGGTTFMLARAGSAPSANPLAGGASAQSGSASALAKTPQDQQIANFLTSTAWCSMSFSGSSNYSSGTSRSSRAVFNTDGTASEVQKGESVNSGSAGTAYGASSNGKQGRWRIENGQLMLSADGMQWAPQTLKIADNGSGSPIVTAGGKEYMVCR